MRSGSFRRRARSRCCGCCKREFERVGGTTTIRADVRVVAASNRNLEASIAAGTFRSDLYYRLGVFPIEVPPLRERREDIRGLVEVFLDRYARRARKSFRGISDKTVALLEAYRWPGNIRELQNVIERSVIMCESEVFAIDEGWLSYEAPYARLAPAHPVAHHMPPALRPPDSHESTATLEQVERDAILRALQSAKWMVGGPNGAAAMLGLKRTTLQARMQKLGIARQKPGNRRLLSVSAA